VTRLAISGCTLAAVAALTAPAAAQQRPVLLVLPFENSGSFGRDKEIFEALELGIPAVLSHALGRQPGAAVVAAKTERRAAGADVPRRLDAGSAAQIGRASGATHVVTGSFSDFYGKFRVSARVIDARSGQILKVVSNDDPRLQSRAALPAVVQSLCDGIAGSVGLPAPDGSVATLPADAITNLGRGLLHESRGDPAGAGEFFRRALSAAPSMEAAEAGLRRVR
jgi:TolB-like protein